MHVVFVQFLKRPNADHGEIAAALRSRRHVAWTASLDDAGDLVCKDGEETVVVLAGPQLLPDNLRRLWLLSSILKRLVYLGFIFRTHRFLRQHRPDIVHVHPGTAFWVCLLPFFMPGHMRFIFDLRTVHHRVESSLMVRLIGLFSDLSRRIPAKYFYHHTCFLHRSAARKLLGKNWRMWSSVVPMGVDQLFLSISRPDMSPGCNDKQVRFLYLGPLTRFRQLEQILLALKHLMSLTDEFRFVFLGLDKTHGYYHRMIQKFNLESHVIIQPPVPYKDVPRYTCTFDVALAYIPDHLQFNPSLKGMEYRALGIPMIATDNDPNRDYVEDGVNGVLVQNSVGNLAEAMLRFIVDRDFLERCQVNARAIRQGITWNDVAEMYEQQVYMPLLNGKHIQESYAR